MTPLTFKNVYVVSYKIFQLINVTGNINRIGVQEKAPKSH